MNSRESILNRLRSSLNQPDRRFPPADTPPIRQGEHLAITRAEGDRWALAERFSNELSTLHGSAEIVETATEARLAAVSRLVAWLDEERALRRTEEPLQSADRNVLSWEPDLLPVPGLIEALTDLGFQLFSPSDLHDDEQRSRMTTIRAGITSADAAFASTGTVLLSGGAGRSRAASLTPYRHLLLIPLSRIYPNVESWIAEQRRGETLQDLLRRSANLTLISGPSKSADIEGNLTLGVHGPRVVHAILFDDIESLIRG